MKAVKHTQVPTWILLGTIAVIVIYGFAGMDRFWLQSDMQRTDSIKQAILRTSAQCYAIEGSYPPDLPYLETNYGLVLDHKKYSYVYEIFASNIRPEVEVLPWNTEIRQQ